MHQLKTVFAFEFMGYLKRKAYIILTVVLMVAVAVVLCWPRISGGFSGSGAETETAGEGGVQTTQVEMIPLVVRSGDAAEAAGQLDELADAAQLGYAFLPFDGDEDALKSAVEAGEYEQGIVLDGPLGYTRIVRQVGMYDFFDDAFSALMLARYQAEALADAGLPADQVQEVLGAQVQVEVETIDTGKDQMRNFIYTYVLIFLLYFAILMYGQFVASSVATEKSTRAMELLITSTKPNSLMFGKVLGAGFAGLLQLVLILGTAFLFYNLNVTYYADNYIVQSIFGMELEILLYMFLFFILGFFIYAFLYASLASLVSRMEDLSTAIMPVTFVFIIAFFIVMFSMAAGQVDTPLLVFCSYFPLTSPMAMFVRIAMGNVAGWEVALSVIILAAATVGVGMLAAAIYRLGVLLYGNAPKPAEVVRMLRARRTGARGTQR